jgi:hypothetical protein
MVTGRLVTGSLETGRFVGVPKIYLALFVFLIMFLLAL